MAKVFADLVPIDQISSHKYTVNLDDAWCIGTVPNGGYITSVFMMVARTHMQKIRPTHSQPDVVNLHLEFLRRTAKGPATFTVRDVKVGSRISNLHIALSQPKDSSDPESPIQDEVEGYFTISSIAAEKGPTKATGYHLLPAPLPVSLSDLSNNDDKNYVLRRSDPYGSFRRATQNIKMHLLRPSARTSEMGPSIADQWVRFTPLSSPNGGRWTNDALGFVVDIFPQIYERYVNADLEDALLSNSNDISDQQIKQMVKDKQAKTGSLAFWYPTLLLNLDVKKKLPDEGVDWLFVRVQAKKIENGRFDLAVEVWDDPIGGELIALSTHASLVVDASRNMTRSGGKDKKKKDSKI